MSNISDTDTSTSAVPAAQPIPDFPQQAVQIQAQQPWAAVDAPQPGIPDNIVSAGPIYTYGLLVSQGRVKGLISDYRTGYLTLTEEAVYLQGQAVLPNRTRLWILIPSILLSLVVAVIVSMVLEYAARRPQFDRLTWDDVKDIVLEPKKGRVCLVYSQPDKPKSIFSLAFKPGPYYDNFEQAARYFAPEKVREGKIGPVNSPWAYAIILLFVVLSIAALMFATNK